MNIFAELLFRRMLTEFGLNENLRRSHRVSHSCMPSIAIWKRYLYEMFSFNGKFCLMCKLFRILYASQSWTFQYTKASHSHYFTNEKYVLWKACLLEIQLRVLCQCLDAWLLFAARVWWKQPSPKDMFSSFMYSVFDVFMVLSWGGTVIWLC